MHFIRLHPLHTSPPPLDSLWPFNSPAPISRAKARGRGREPLRIDTIRRGAGGSPMARCSGRGGAELGYEEIRDTGGVPVRAWTRGVPFEEEARRQLARVARLPFVHSHVAAMPDVHLGIGATVGSVIPTVGAIVPAAVGVDIGCGMIAQRTSLRAAELPDRLDALRSEIEEAVPHGGGRGGRIGSWDEAPAPAGCAWRALADRYERIVARHPAT